MYVGSSAVCFFHLEWPLPMLSGIVGDSGLLIRSRTRLEPFDSARATRGVLSSVSGFASRVILVEFRSTSVDMWLTFGRLLDDSISASSRTSN